jgi:hypothetical protein
MDGRRYRVSADVRSGNFNAGAESGVEFDADHICTALSADAALALNFFVGASAGYGQTDVEVQLPQGVATFVGDGGRYQAHAGYTSGGFFAVAALGYASTKWEIVTTGGSVLTADTKGQIGHLDAGYRFALDKQSALTLSGRVEYDGATCGDNCLMAGTVEDASHWSAKAGARLDTSFLADTLKPFLALGITNQLDGEGAVRFGGATSISDVGSMVLDADLGFNFVIESDTALFARGRLTHGLDSEVEGFEANGGIRLVW